MALLSFTAMLFTWFTELIKIKTFDHKSEKNRSQVVMKTLEDCNKIQYISKRRKRCFYKKIDFLYFRTVEMSWFKKVFSLQSS